MGSWRGAARVGLPASIDGRAGGSIDPPGVYAVGHVAITRGGDGWRRCSPRGPGAVLSHRSAAALWGIWGSGRGRSTSRCRGRAARDGSIRRHFALLPADEVDGPCDGIPVTTVPRTIFDLAATERRGAVESALREVGIPADLRHRSRCPTCSSAIRGDRGAASVAQRLGRVAAKTPAAHPQPARGALPPVPRLPTTAAATAQRLARRRRASEYQVDCLWPEPASIVELDGLRSHGTTRGLSRGPQRAIGASGSPATA